MPGAPFFPCPEHGIGTLRLNFSHANPREAERGLAILALATLYKAVNCRACCLVSFPNQNLV